MKKAWLSLVLIGGAILFAQEKAVINVKEAVVSTGVVIVTAEMNGKSVELQCTQSMPFCTALKIGKYSMVLLPKNHGLYDCQNVDVYSGDNANPGAAQKLGEFCLTAK